MSEALRYNPFPKGQPTTSAVRHATPMTDNTLSNNSVSEYNSEAVLLFRQHIRQLCSRNRTP